MRLQQTWRERVETQDRFGPLHYVAGADMAFDPETNVAFAGVIVYRFPELEEVERRMAQRRRSASPTFRDCSHFAEGHLIKAALAKLRVTPGVILVDGHGVAHPRRFGIACRLGLLLDCPTIGCGKSILVGEAAEPDSVAGSTAPLIHQGETVGMALRTRDRVQAHLRHHRAPRLVCQQPCALLAQCTDGFRIPKPTREADHWVGELRRAYQAGRKQQSA